MCRLFVGNFDFEWSLSGGGTRGLPRSLERINRELSWAWLATAASEDVVWIPGGADSSFLEELGAELPWKLPRVVNALAEAPEEVEGVCWGWSARGEAELERAGRRAALRPDLEVVRRVNSRAFSVGLEEEFGCGLVGGAFVTDEESLRAALQDGEGDVQIASHVLKANYSNSARERLIVRGGRLSDAEWNWARRRLAGGIAVEPWVKIESEAGVQWEIPHEGEPELLGVTQLITDSEGRYRGSVFSAGDEFEAEWGDAIDAGRAAVNRIAAAGYFGPVGFDACRWREASGALRLRPLMDVNARWTLGRLSLGWRRLLQAGDLGVWRFGAESERDRWRFPEPDRATVARVVCTSPQDAGRLSSRVEIYGTTRRD
jgi:hypothetical protein